MGIKGYNTYFSIASIALLVMLSILYHLQQRLKIKQVFYYKALIYSLLAVNCMDLWAALVKNAVIYQNIIPGPHYLTGLPETLLSVAIAVLTAGFYNYLLAMSHCKSGTFTWRQWILFTPLLLYAFAAVVSFLIGWKFINISLIPFMYFAGYMVWLLIKRKKMGKGQFYTCFAFCAAPIAGAAIQALFFRNTMITWFITSLILLAIYFYQQSPDYFLDRIGHVFNKEGFQEVIAEDIAYRREFAVLFIIVDDVNVIYRNFGTSIQNKVIQSICADITEICGTDVFRQDSRFYVIFEKEREAVEKGKLIAERLKEPREVERFRIRLSSRMLAFHYPSHIDTVEDINSITDYFALKSCKVEAGVLHLYDDELFEKQKRYASIKSMLETAILEDGFEMYYQPILCTCDHRFHSAEALVRLKDDKTMGYISPEEFSYIAEKENLIFDMEKIILNKIGKFLGENNLGQHGISCIEINLSGKQCMQTDLADQLENILMRYKISPSFINFEITETANIDMTPSVRVNIDRVIASGASFALDDYGSGYANLDYMTNIPFEMVKIDKEIIWSYFRTEDLKVKAILPSTVRMLKRMDTKIVAEGIETKEQEKVLTAMGIEYLQGYYFSKPISEEEFLSFLIEHNETNI